MNAMDTVNALAAAVVATREATAEAAFTDAVTEAAELTGGAAAGFCGYYPEMSEAKPVAQIEARLAHYGRHYFIKTPLTLKGRGIEFRGVLTADSLVGGAANRLCGWNEYKVTLNAFEKLEAQYRIASEMLL